MITVREDEVSVPLCAERLTAALLPGSRLWQPVQVVTQTGSTNGDLLAQAAAGGGEGLVLAAEEQSAGKGRLGRTWASAPGAGLTFSVLLRPAGVPAGLLGWLPLLAGVAVAGALQEVTAIGASLKWPNDVLVADGKLAGILAESHGPAVVIGMGINVCQQPADLPVPTATSVLAEQARLAGPGGAGPGGAGAGGAGAGGAGAGGAGAAAAAGPGAAGAAGLPLRERLLIAVLAGLEHWYTAWTGAGGDAGASGLRAGYLALSGTIGREVRVLLPGDRVVAGQAVDVDAAARLVVQAAGQRVEISAGDVVHVR
jgi:BirA family transcriptional regulator, biotin operon repressor / biotin---[acetyl-CoA-carboxylase] ligase